MKRFLLLTLAMAGILGMAACGGGNAANGSTGNAGKKIDKLIITAIPDENSDAFKGHFGNIAKYIESKIGIPCEYMHVENYAAAVTALANGQAHMSWMGGVTTVQSDMQTKGNAVVVACRDTDKKFVSYFIASKDSGIGEVKDLKALADAAAGKSFTFGSKGSTSGHLMPRHFFTTQAGKKPEDAFKSVSYSGSHDKSLEQVASGTHDVGALNYAVYDRITKEKPELKDKARVIYKTPEYVDYCFVAHKDLGDELIAKIRAALVGLDPASEEGKTILGYWKAGKMVEADMSEWAGIKAVMEAGVDIGG